jgi:hypothetical protein
VVEGTGLENRRALRGPVGSNPTPTASSGDSRQSLDLRTPAAGDRTCGPIRGDCVAPWSPVLAASRLRHQAPLVDESHPHRLFRSVTRRFRIRRRRLSRVHSSSSTSGCACESRIGRRAQAPSRIFGTQGSVADQSHSIRRGGYWPRDRAIRCPRGNRHEVLRAEGLRRQRRSRPRRNGRPRSRRPIVAIPLGKGDEELPS